MSRPTRRLGVILAGLVMTAGLAAAATTHRVPQSSLPAMRGMPAGVDSGPSEDARRVLETIPDPLAPSQQVAPSATALAAARTADSMRAAAARADSARITALGDSLIAAADSSGADTAAVPGAAADSLGADTAAVPVPTPVPTLADRGRGEAALDTALAITPSADSTRVAPGIPPPGECWGVQVGAPTERDKAETLRKAAQSLLLVPMTILDDHGRHKVRTTRCLGAAAADSLRRRAVLTGFTGAFRFGGHK